MEVSEIESLTREHFADLAEGPLSVTVIDRGGSGRLFARFTKDDGRGIVAMHYSLERPENGRFAEITEFLQRHGVPSPALRDQLEVKHLLWMEDLGPDDLAQTQGDDWDTVRAPLYRAALEAVFQLHRIAEAEQPADMPPLEPPFDSGLYAWEQRYFFEHFVTPFSECPEAEKERIAESEELNRLALELADQPRRLIHRDFQSSNIMIRDGRPWLIDYQGMRWGVPEYDVASLLYDPYVDLSAGQREELARHYFSLKEATGDPEYFETYHERLRQCAAQRLMQALGAYGNLGLNRGQKNFLDFIPVALDRLREVAVDRGTIPLLSGVLSLRDSHVA